MKLFNISLVATSTGSSDILKQLQFVEITRIGKMKEKIINHIKEKYLKGNADDIGYSTALLSSGIIDSITALDLVEFIETSFGIEFKAHEVSEENLNTVDLIADFIESKKN